MPISSVFSLTNLAPCQFHLLFLSRIWRHANFIRFFSHEFGAVPISSVFSLTSLAPCQFHLLFPSRIWRHANFICFFPHEFGAMPILSAFSLTSLAPCQFHLFFLSRVWRRANFICKKYRIFSSGIIFLIKIARILLLVHVHYHLIMLSVLSARHARTNLIRRLVHVHTLNIYRCYQY